MDWLLPPAPSADWPMLLQILCWFGYVIAGAAFGGLVNGTLMNLWLRHKEHKAETEYVKMKAAHYKALNGDSYKNETPMANGKMLQVMNSYALAPMDAEGYPQWTGMVMSRPSHNEAIIGVMTTAGMWAGTGLYSECVAGFGSMINAEMKAHQYVIVPAAKSLSYLGKWMSDIAPGLFAYQPGTPGSQASSSKTLLTLPPNNVADLSKLWQQSGSMITTAATFTPGQWPPSVPVKFLYEEPTWASTTITQKPEPALIETELVPDVACRTGSKRDLCGHRLTSHVQNKPGESGPCVIPGCVCEQWRNVCAECGMVSYPWRYRHTAACKSGQRMRQVLADRAELEQIEKRNRRARTSIEQIPEDF